MALNWDDTQRSCVTTDFIQGKEIFERYMQPAPKLVHQKHTVPHIMSSLYTKYKKCGPTRTREVTTTCLYQSNTATSLFEDQMELHLTCQINFIVQKYN